MPIPPAKLYAFLRRKMPASHVYYLWMEIDSHASRS
jgi:hypothetical protein